MSSRQLSVLSLSCNRVSQMRWWFCVFSYQPDLWFCLFHWLCLESMWDVLISAWGRERGGATRQRVLEAALTSISNQKKKIISSSCLSLFCPLFVNRRLLEKYKERGTATNSMHRTILHNKETFFRSSFIFLNYSCQFHDCFNGCIKFTQVCTQVHFITINMGMFQQYLTIRDCPISFHFT